VFSGYLVDMSVLHLGQLECRKVLQSFGASSFSSPVHAASGINLADTNLSSENDCLA